MTKGNGRMKKIVTLVFVLLTLKQKKMPIPLTLGGKLYAGGF